jgi:hypothetical protein
MPDVAGGWVRSLLGTLGAILGAKLYILGVAGYDTPIWDVLAPEEEREEAGEPLCGAKFVQISRLFLIRKAVPGGLARAPFCSWAHWVRFFMVKNVYYGIYSVFTHNLMFSICQERREWMDGSGWIWM